MSQNTTYKDAGVDIDKANALVHDIRKIAKRTHRPGILAGIGGFGAQFEIPSYFNEPVIVSGTDGVGTKLKLAIDLNRHDTIGIDLVAMCANDIICCGAEPLFFLDYYAMGKLNSTQAYEVLSGIGRGCELAGCALIGGETAEMPGMYAGDDYDLAGFCVGAVEKSKIIDGSKVQVGDIVIGLASSGPHSNGYSLIRHVIAQNHIDITIQLEGKPLCDWLLTPTRIYVKSILSLLKQVDVHALAHITGGGLTENIPRVLPENTVAQLNYDSWSWPIIFKWLQDTGRITFEEMIKSFNVGIGMVVIVSADKAQLAIDTLHSNGEDPCVIGDIGLKMSTLVLISGNGSNLQAMIDAAIPISAVISNQADAFGLKRAAIAHIPTHVIDHKKFASRALFDTALQAQIEKYRPQLVIMAGFMRILSDFFVQHFYGRLINIHPSLLPHYKGLHTHKRVLENNETLHGATTHYVNTELDGGPIIAQAQLIVDPKEAEEHLATRIHALEHILYPYTIQLILAGRVCLMQDRVLFDGSPLAKSGIMLNL